MYESISGHTDRNPVLVRACTKFFFIFITRYVSTMYLKQNFVLQNKIANERKLFWRNDVPMATSQEPVRSWTVTYGQIIYTFAFFSAPKYMHLSMQRSGRTRTVKMRVCKNLSRQFNFTMRESFAKIKCYNINNKSIFQLPK